MERHVPGTGIKANTGYLRTTCSNIDDTSMPGGSEAYMGDSMYYGNVKMAAKAGQESARSIYYDLKMCFPGGRIKKLLPPSYKIFRVNIVEVRDLKNLQPFFIPPHFLNRNFLGQKESNLVLGEPLPIL